MLNKLYIHFKKKKKKEPTELCSGKQMNTEKEMRATKPSITDPTNHSAFFEPGPSPFFL